MERARGGSSGSGGTRCSSRRRSSSSLRPRNEPHADAQLVHPVALEVRDALGALRSDGSSGLRLLGHVDEHEPGVRPARRSGGADRPSRRSPRPLRRWASRRAAREVVRPGVVRALEDLADVPAQLAGLVEELRPAVGADVVERVRLARAVARDEDRLAGDRRARGSRLGSGTPRPDRRRPSRRTRRARARRRRSPRSCSPRPASVGRGVQSRLRQVLAALRCGRARLVGVVDRVIERVRTSEPRPSMTLREARPTGSRRRWRTSGSRS